MESNFYEELICYFVSSDQKLFLTTDNLYFLLKRITEKEKHKTTSYVTVPFNITNIGLKKTEKMN